MFWENARAVWLIQDPGKDRKMCSPILTDYIIQEVRTTDLNMVENIWLEQTFCLQFFIVFVMSLSSF